MNIIVNILRRLNIIPVPLVDTQSQIVRARAIIEANRLGVFAALAQEAADAATLAQRLNISTEGATVLLQALAGVGYLKQRNGRYENGRWVNKWILDKESGLSNYLKLQQFVWMRLESLGDNVQSGRPKLDYHQEAVATPSETQTVYTNAMREVAHMMLPHFVKRVDLPETARCMLDIGGAHGDYSRALLQRYPNLKGTVMDLAGPINTAKATMRAEDHTLPLEFRIGNALEDDLGTGWDVILLVNVVHIFNPAQNRLLYRHAYEALNPGGLLIVTDQFLGLNKRRDELTSLLSLNFYNAGGRCYDIDEMKSLLQEAKFVQLKVKPFPLWLPVTLIEAKK